MYGCIALVVLERSSGIQLVFLKRLDLQPSAEDDGKRAEDDGKGAEDDDKGVEDDGKGAEDDGKDFPFSIFH